MRQALGTSESAKTVACRSPFLAGQTGHTRVPHAGGRQFQITRELIRCRAGSFDVDLEVKSTMPAVVRQALG